MTILARKPGCRLPDLVGFRLGMVVIWLEQGETWIIEVYVRYLRRKMEAGGEPRLVQTIRGTGHTLPENI